MTGCEECVFDEKKAFEEPCCYCNWGMGPGDTLAPPTRGVPKEGPFGGGGARPGKPELPGAGTGSLLEGILANRAKTHGDFGIHAACTQDLKRMAKSWMKAAGKNGLDNDKQEALDMIFHKVGRIVAGDPDTEDHWRDIAGYATLVADRCKVS
ncbi:MULTISPECIES: DUF6378 domain-containing protein [unclassified Xanthobacter]|uniref:DUF6378 domain-containing protein n=1 Tax=unclassified Xanthobacter TaxID=2623496 RepID=UPI001F2977A4|nr:MULTISPECIES: DUF6378 domain-containing protein [unclassified Xanthobacter]